MSIVSRDLGSDPRRQTKVYSMIDLLSEKSLAWCGIRAGLERRRRELGFEEQNHSPRGYFLLSVNFALRV